MSYDFERLLDEYNIDHKPINSRGWIPIFCLYCNSSKYHGDFYLDRNFFTYYMRKLHPHNRNL